MRSPLEVNITTQYGALSMSTQLRALLLSFEGFFQACFFFLRIWQHIKAKHFDISL